MSGFSPQKTKAAGSHRRKRLGKAINYRAVQPPSMSKVCPVMSDAAGEARKTTAPLTNSMKRCDTIDDVCSE
jgi:hypothetical protein